MKILYVAHYFLPNMAAGVTTKEIVKMLFRKGHEVTLIAPSTYMMDNSSMQKFNNGFKLKPAYIGISKEIAKRSKLVSMLIATLGYVGVFITGLKTAKRDGPFNVVIVQYHAFHVASLVSYILSKFMRIPLIIKIHDIAPTSPSKRKIQSIYNTILLNVNKVAFAHACLVLSLSTEITRILVELINVDASKIMNFPNSVSSDFQSSSDFAEKLRSRLNLDDKKIVLFISEVPGRGLEVLLKAVHILKDECIVLIVIGTYQKKHVMLTKLLRIDNMVVFIGEVGHKLIPHYIHMADVCVGPLTSAMYTYGAVPRKVIECMACGKPVIVARNAVTKDLAKDGASAISVDSNSEIQVAAAIMSLVHKNSLSMAISKRAQTIITEKYITEKLMEKLDEKLIATCTRGRMISNSN